MKLSLITAAVLSMAIFSGCTASSAKPVVTSPSVAPAPSTPVAVAPTPSPEPEEQPGSDFTADGRMIVKGDVWELDVANPEDWTQRPSGAEFSMVNPDKRIMVILRRDDWVGSQANYIKSLIDELKQSGGLVVLQRGVMINDRNGVLVEGVTKSAHFMVWAFNTPAEGFALLCGSQVASFTQNKSTCEDLAAHFYIGKLPH